MFVWMGVIYLLSSLQQVPGPNLFPHVDKVAHLSVFAVLAFLTWRAVVNQTALPFIKVHAMVMTLFITSLYGIIDEIHQIFVPGRKFDYADMGADAAGAVVCIALIILWKKIQRPVPASGDRV